MLTPEAIRPIVPNFGCIEVTATSAFTKFPAGAMRPDVKKIERYAGKAGLLFSFDFPEYIVTMRLSCPTTAIHEWWPAFVMRAP